MAGARSSARFRSVTVEGRHAQSRVSFASYALDMDVVAKTGAFSKKVPYDDVVDMQFVRKALQKK
jgi:hypothetical protein